MTTPAPAAATFAEAQEVLAAKLPGYTRRAHQMQLAERYELVLSSGGHALFQAGTGTGKSLAILIPIILSGERVVVATATKALQGQYCVAPDSGILTADLRYIAARSVTEGMKLAGFDEERSGNRRNFREAVVERVERIRRPCYLLTFDDNTQIISSSEHKWLVAQTMEVKWMTTEQLCPAAGKRQGSKIIRLFDTWNEDRSYESGYLAAAFDGEGWLTQRSVTAGGFQNVLGFAQKDNAMLALVRKCLDRMSIAYTESTSDDCTRLQISYRDDIVKLLGTCRPGRLLPKFNFDKLGAINIRRNNGVLGKRVIAKQFVGERDVMAITTSTRTLVVEGLASHNCSKDLPFLEAHLGVPFTWAVIKGRANYPCYAKGKEIAAPTRGQQQVLDRMAELSGKQAVVDLEITDREDFPAVPEHEWAAFSMSSTECPGKKSCPFGEICIAERAKAKAAEAQIVVTNTAYLLTDLNFRSQTEGNVQLLGEIDRVVIDEGHTLGDVATSTLEDTMGEGSLAKLGRDMAAYLDRAELDERLGLAIEPAAAALWETLGDMHTLFTRKVSRTDPMPLSPQQLIDDLGPKFVALYQAIDKARLEVGSRRGYDEAEKMARTRILKRSANQLDRIRAYTTDPASKTVRWAELEVSTFRGQQRERLYLRSAPVSVAPFLRSALWEKFPTTLMSATLSTGKDRRTGQTDFSYLERTIGLDRGEAATYDAGSPFEYPRQAMLFTPAKGAPEPVGANVPAWRTYAQAVSGHLVRESGGGALLLFTSRSAMNEAWKGLADQFEAKGLHCMKQGDAPAGELVRMMKEDGNAVLFALRTFFEGIDIQGSALRLVVIDKLPFTPPTDLVHKARCEAVNAEYNDQWAMFEKLIVPEMLLILTQAFGRLIRHADDKGVIAILDPRLNTKGYGRKILAALPPARQTTDIEAASSFLRSAR